MPPCCFAPPNLSMSVVFITKCLPRSVSGVTRASEPLRTRPAWYMKSWKRQPGNLHFVVGCISDFGQIVYPHIFHLLSNEHTNVCTLHLSYESARDNRTSHL